MGKDITPYQQAMRQLSTGIDHGKQGACPFCGRVCPLTFHHYIPKKLHRRNFFRKQYHREALNQGIYICRLCHNGIHDRYDEMTLAKTFAHRKALQSDPDLQRHYHWVAKQKLR